MRSSTLILRQYGTDLCGTVVGVPQLDTTVAGKKIHFPSPHPSPYRYPCRLPCGAAPYRHHARLEVGSNQTAISVQCIWNIPPTPPGTIHLFLSRFSFSSFGGSETKQLRSIVSTSGSSSPFEVVALGSLPVASTIPLHGRMPMP